MTAAAQTDSTLAGAAALIGFIPKDVRYDCTIDPAPKPAGIETEAGSVRVGLVCPGPAGFTFVEYYLFATNASMKSVYTQVMGNTGTQPVRSAEGNCPSDGTWELAGQDVGSVGCYYATETLNHATGQRATVAEYPVLNWTYDAQNILAEAALVPGNDDAAALQTWWHDKAGPTKTADEVSGVVTSAAGQRKFQRALLAQIPAVTRKTCKTEDVFDPANTTSYAQRLWFRAVADCTTNGGADFVTYESIDPSAVAPYFASLLTSAKSYESPTQPDRKCPATGTYTDGKPKHSHTLGEYACFTDQTSTGYNNGAAFAKYWWSDPKRGVVAYANNPKNDPDALIAWFYGPKSGPQ